MRIALVVERFEPGGGGVEEVARQLARGLLAAGDRVVVVSRCGQPEPGVELLRVCAGPRWKPLRTLAFSRAAARAAPRERFDAVYSLARTRHQHVFRAGGGSHAEYLRRRHGRAARTLRRLSPRHRVLEAVERAVFRDRSQTIVCASQLVRDSLAQRHGVERARLAVLCNGVDADRFHPELDVREGRALRRALGTGDEPVWLFAGSGFARKGLDTALRALGRDRERRALLWVAGRDPQAAWRRAAARLGIADRVRWLGPRRDMERIYRAADALLLPTRYDAFANVCLEAAASGLPVVTSRANGAAELLRGAGIVVDDAEDAIGFAKALEALEDAGLRGRLGAQGRRIAEARPWPEHVTALRRILAGGAP